MNEGPAVKIFGTLPTYPALHLVKVIGMSL